MQKPVLIINADDFGRDNYVNKNIIDYLISGKITSTTIMGNGPAFEQACELIHKNKIRNKIGVHLTLDEGFPISEEMKKNTNADGTMCIKRKILIRDRTLLNAIYSELRAQIKRVMQYDITPTHLDSHRHIHTSFSIGRIVVRLAREFGINYIRRSLDAGRDSVFYVRAYKRIFNFYLSSQIGTTDHFVDLLDFYKKYGINFNLCGVTECMCHLDASERGRKNQNLLFSAEFRQFLSNFELIDFSLL